MYFLRCKLMKTAGIIAEYNPFHTGHAYHIQKTRETTGADYIIVVLSGDFVQRGGPAFFSKHQRTRMALLGGADLVLELPASHACQSAEFFAQSGVLLLQALGCVDYLSFGSESGDIRPFLTLGQYLSREPEDFRELLQRELKSGLSFPAARQKALRQLILKTPDTENFLSSPNNILGIEYCKALSRLKSRICPLTIRREGSGYHENTLGEAYPSASAIRKAFSSLTPDRLSFCFPKSLTQNTDFKELISYPMEEEDFSLLLRWFLMGTDEKKLASFQDLNQDLARRLINTRDKYENFSQYVMLLKTKELTYSRISRALFHALLDIREVPPLSYARILGFRQSSVQLLSRIKKESRLPLLTKLADASSFLNKDAQYLLAQNTRISNLYETVLCDKYKKPFTHEYTKPIIIIK